MIIRVKIGSDPAAVQRALVERGLWVRRLDESGPQAAVLFLVEEHSRAVESASLLSIEGVAGVAIAPSAHPRVDAQARIVTVAGIDVGVGAAPVVMAGPCAIESERQVREVADRLRPRGVTFLRGGAFKPRTSPYSFHGHGDAALHWMRAAADENGMRVVTEVMSPEDAPRVAELADLVQIGSRSMQNFPLLKAVAKTGKPVLLKRGMAASVDEWLAAGEWCLAHGAPSVIFCERGIRGFDPSTRNLLDLGAVALLATVHGLPVIVDPSHATGRRDLIAPLARAAIAAGAAGLMLETHDHPGAALSDGPQALTAEELADVLASIEPVQEKRAASPGKTDPAGKTRRVAS